MKVDWTKLIVWIVLLILSFFFWYTVGYLLFRIVS